MICRQQIVIQRIMTCIMISALLISSVIVIEPHEAYADEAAGGVAYIRVGETVRKL